MRSRFCQFWNLFGLSIFRFFFFFFLLTDLTFCLQFNYKHLLSLKTISDKITSLSLQVFFKMKNPGRPFSCKTFDGFISKTVNWLIIIFCLFRSCPIPKKLLHPSKKPCYFKTVQWTAFLYNVVLSRSRLFQNCKCFNFL